MKSKLTPIYKLPFEQKFKWRGKFYNQLLRPKDIKRGMIVFVQRVGFSCERMRFPSGRLVKPVIKCNKVNNEII